MRDTLVCWEERVVEDLTGVNARELSGLGDGMEDLPEGVAVDGKVIDGFVGGWSCFGSKGGLRKHGKDGASVGLCKWFTLDPGTFSQFGFARRRGGGIEWGVECQRVVIYFSNHGGVLKTNRFVLSHPL